MKPITRNEKSKEALFIRHSNSTSDDHGTDVSQFEKARATLLILKALTSVSRLLDPPAEFETGGGQNPESRNPDSRNPERSKSRTAQSPEGSKSRMGQNPEGSKSRISRKCTVKCGLASVVH
ncbi:hypothetical protein M514_00716 [Trichuris suis]|uniref:Uncharacterized protein n=1 Tax=Trichuris suis TaxID=68888 RepID=A0A085MMP4_9BILA|nr:hypothetical protein M513_00716 [Trichuris suis]KFD65119.1 hypothetical protein M514_00716 [Trichuris suis]